MKIDLSFITLLYIHLLFLQSQPLSCAFLPSMLHLGLHLPLHHRLPHPHMRFSFPLQVILPQHPLPTSLQNHQLPKPTFVVLALVPWPVLMANMLLMFVLTMMTLHMFLMIYRLLMGHSLLMRYQITRDIIFVIVVQLNLQIAMDFLVLLM
jgi:hypothetical protein